MESQGPKLVGGCRGRLRTRPPCQPPAFRECADLKIQSLAKEASTLCNQLLGLGLEFPPQVSPDSGRLCILGIFLSLRVPSWGGQLGTETEEEVGITGRAQGIWASEGHLGRWQVASGVIGLWMRSCPSALGGDARASSPASWAPERPCTAMWPSQDPPPISAAGTVFTTGGGGQGEAPTLPSPACVRGNSGPQEAGPEGLAGRVHPSPRDPKEPRMVIMGRWSRLGSRGRLSQGGHSGQTG